MATLRRMPRLCHAWSRTEKSIFSLVFIESDILHAPKSKSKLILQHTKFDFLSSFFKNENEMRKKNIIQIQLLFKCRKKIAFKKQAGHFFSDDIQNSYSIYTFTAQLLSLCKFMYIFRKILKMHIAIYVYVLYLERIFFNHSFYYHHYVAKIYFQNWKN